MRASTPRTEAELFRRPSVRPREPFDLGIPVGSAKETIRGTNRIFWTILVLVMLHPASDVLAQASITLTGHRFHQLYGSRELRSPRRLLRLIGSESGAFP